METVELNPAFEQVLKFVNETNRLIFLTGKAGTGKTTLLKYIRQHCFKQMAVVAPTGVAAINAGGATIHSFFQFPFGPFLVKLKESGEPDAARNQLVLKYTAQRLAIFRNLELLIIDEVSMVRADLLDQIDITLRHTRKKWQQPFGGVQVLFIGDMYQLPPVVQSEEWTLLSDTYASPFFFESKVLQQHPPVFIELEKIYRQTNQVFIDLLNKVRNNRLEAADIDLLNSRFKPHISDDAYQANVTLTTHNRKADEINQRNLQKLNTKAHSYKAVVDGQFPEKSYPADETLVLKEGARVMFLKNNSEKNYYNGKIGIVTSLSDDRINVVGDEDQLEIEVGREVWTNVAYKVDKSNGHLNEDILGTFSQYPLRLAWAITIHKSQGLTFNKLIIDAADSFSAGQVYVALSRCRQLEGLTLSSRISNTALISDQAVRRFSDSKHSGDQIRNIFSGARHDYLQTMLLNLFDFSEIASLRSEAGVVLSSAKSRLPQQGVDWAMQLFDALEQIKDVADKFRNQIQQLLLSAQDVEADPALQERVQKAAVYFTEAVARQLDGFKQIPLVTESKETAEQLTPLFQQLLHELSAKHQLLKACTNGFRLSDVVKAKLNLRLPETRLSLYANAGNVKIANVKHPALYKDLLNLRDELCEEFQRPIYMVASNKTLEDLVTYLPASSEELLRIKGFGEAKVAAYGDRFLQRINQYRREHQLESAMLDMEPAKQKKAKKSKKTQEPGAEKISSKEQTFALFQQGRSPSDIAQQRGMTLGTVQSHLLPYVASGNIGLERLVSPQAHALISTLLDNTPANTALGELKRKLPEHITYAEIRFVLAHQSNNP